MILVTTGGKIHDDNSPKGVIGSKVGISGLGNLKQVQRWKQRLFVRGGRCVWECLYRAKEMRSPGASAHGEMGGAADVFEVKKT